MQIRNTRSSHELLHSTVDAKAADLTPCVLWGHPSVLLFAGKPTSISPHNVRVNHGHTQSLHSTQHTHTHTHSTQHTAHTEHTTNTQQTEHMAHKAEHTAQTTHTEHKQYTKHIAHIAHRAQSRQSTHSTHSTAHSTHSTHSNWVLLRWLHSFGILVLLSN
jgi:hypothetical protein